MEYEEFEDEEQDLPLKQADMEAHKAAKTRIKKRGVEEPKDPYLTRSHTTKARYVPGKMGRFKTPWGGKPSEGDEMVTLEEKLDQALFEETQTSTIGGKKIKEKKGKLTGDLGKPAMQASEKELQSYIDAASGKEKQRRVARVNLMRAHKKGHKAQGNKT